MIDELKTPYDFIDDLTKAIEQTRVLKRLTQKELCKISGVSLSTYQKFLYQKSISLTSVVKIIYSLDMIENLSNFAKAPEPLTLTDLKAKSKLPKRVKSAKS